MRIPFTTIALVDLAIALIFILCGVWIFYRRRHWVGWVMIGVSLYWVYLLVPYLR